MNCFREATFKNVHPEDIGKNVLSNWNIPKIKEIKCNTIICGHKIAWWKPKISQKLDPSLPDHMYMCWCEKVFNSSNPYLTFILISCIDLKCWKLLYGNNAIYVISRQMEKIHIDQKMDKKFRITHMMLFFF